MSYDIWLEQPYLHRAVSAAEEDAMNEAEDQEVKQFVLDFRCILIAEQITRTEAELAKYEEGSARHEHLKSVLYNFNYLLDRAIAKREKGPE